MYDLNALLQTIAPDDESESYEIAPDAHVMFSYPSTGGVIYLLWAPGQEEYTPSRTIYDSEAEALTAAYNAFHQPVPV